MLCDLKNARVVLQPYKKIKSVVTIVCQYFNDSIVNNHYIMEQLKQVEIGTSIYYPQPVPRMKYYREKMDTVNQNIKMLLLLVTIL